MNFLKSRARVVRRGTLRPTVGRKVLFGQRLAEKSLFGQQEAEKSVFGQQEAEKSLFGQQEADGVILLIFLHYSFRICYKNHHSFKKNRAVAPCGESKRGDASTGSSPLKEIGFLFLLLPR